LAIRQNGQSVSASARRRLLARAKAVRTYNQSLWSTIEGRNLTQGPKPLLRFHPSAIGYRPFGTIYQAVKTTPSLDDMLREAAYRLTQSARIGWFFTEYMLGRYAALSPEQRQSGNIPAVLRLLRHDFKGLTTRSTTGVPTFLDLLDDVRELMQRDLANIRAGIYGLPDDLTATPLHWLADARRYFADLLNVLDRRRRNGWDDIAREADLSAYPSYYRRNFHYQSGGYISNLSARLYDHQVEVLFFGAADAMRRQALVPLAHFLRGRRSVETRLLDVGCGTGRFLCMLKNTYPRLPVFALDLSLSHLVELRRRLRSFSRWQAVQGLAEDLPFPDASVDVVTCLYLFHEVPTAIQRAIASEFARVLRPGGRAILVDSIQKSDVPGYDRMLDAFPVSFHEPYYADYLQSELDALFFDAGLAAAGHTRAFLSKVMVYDKPTFC
jgi:ubiquinone/menaquinone biosynthesis C-methylase UbiE